MKMQSKRTKRRQPKIMQTKLSLPISMIKRVLCQNYSKPVINIKRIKPRQPFLSKKISEMAPDQITRDVIDDKYNQAVIVKGFFKPQSKQRTKISFQALCILMHTGTGWKPESMIIKFSKEKGHFYRFESTRAIKEVG